MWALLVLFMGPLGAHPFLYALSGAGHPAHRVLVDWIPTVVVNMSRGAATVEPAHVPQDMARGGRIIAAVWARVIGSGPNLVGNGLGNGQMSNDLGGDIGMTDK